MGLESTTRIHHVTKARKVIGARSQSDVVAGTTEAVYQKPESADPRLITLAHKPPRYERTASRDAEAAMLTRLGALTSL